MNMHPKQLAFNFNPPVISSLRINRPDTAAGRWIRLQFPMPALRADLIAALAGYVVEA